MFYHYHTHVVLLASADILKVVQTKRRTFTRPSRFYLLRERDYALYLILLPLFYQG